MNIGNRYIKDDTIRALLAKSGNQCAFNGCKHPIFNEENLYIANLCHIEAVSPNGERYNRQQTDEERNGYDNLILLCYRHHKETNDVKRYDVAKLKQIKREHEQTFTENPFSFDESLVYKIKVEMETFWTEVDRLHTTNHSAPDDMKIEVETTAKFENLIDEVYELYTSINEIVEIFQESDTKMEDTVKTFLKEIGYNTDILDKIPYYESPISSRLNWEYHNLAIPNLMGKLFLRLKQLELKYYEAYLRSNPNDLEVRYRMEMTKVKFKDLSQNSIYND
jgi:hypothetical protein